MRIVTLSIAEDTTITEFARIDVTTCPVAGCRAERAMSARYDPASSRQGPFEGDRLRSAIWNPVPADILVAADTHVASALPAAVLDPLPWIFVFEVWPRMMVACPSLLLPLCWNRGGARLSPGRTRCTLEAEVSLLADMLTAMLHLASPLELVARSRPAWRPLR